MRDVNKMLEHRERSEWKLVNMVPRKESAFSTSGTAIINVDIPPDALILIFLTSKLGMILPGLPQMFLMQIE